MLRFPASVRIFLCLEPADMRRSFDGLSGIVRSIIRESPTCGHLFVFRNKRRDRVKILWWDRDGFAIFYKRLEKGTFHFPASGDRGGQRCEVDQRDFAMILEGFEQNNLRKHSRFQRPAICAMA
jgi:transposase